MRRMDLSIAIVSWNTRDLLDGCLESIFETTHGIEFEVILVDNASSDGSAEMVRGKYPQVRLIENADNVGFAAANNQAFDVSSGRYFMILNPDTKVLTDLAPLVAFLDSDRALGAVGCKCVNPDLSIQRNWYDYYPCFLWEMAPHGARELAQRLIYRRNPDAQFDTKWVGGQCMTVSREVVEAVGGLDSGYFMYSEETDWCFRIRKAGWRVCHYPGVTVIHYGGQSTKQVSSRMVVELYRSKHRFVGANLSVSRARLFKTGLLARVLLQRLVARLRGGGEGREARVAQLDELIGSVRRF